MVDQQDDDNWALLPGDSTLVVRTQPALWVYRNPGGALVIRMESLDPHEPDPFVFIQPQYIDTVILALQKARDEAEPAAG